MSESGFLLHSLFFFFLLTGFELIDVECWALKEKSDAFIFALEHVQDEMSW